MLLRAYKKIAHGNDSFPWATFTLAVGKHFTIAERSFHDPEGIISRCEATFHARRSLACWSDPLPVLVAIR